MLLDIDVSNKGDKLITGSTDIRESPGGIVVADKLLGIHRVSGALGIASLYLHLTTNWRFGQDISR
ncbi:hypothetical protein J6590_005759 [Homalodisca vitripennis]|nr:hypothetical protein J6590_005759 [Homalodisca vitripennis]